MSDMLSPLFLIATGLSFAMVLVIGLLARKSIQTVAGRITAFAVLAVAAGFFFLSQASKGTLSAGAEMFMAAGAAFFLAAVLVTVGQVIRARSAD